MSEIRKLKQISQEKIRIIGADVAIIRCEGDPYEGEYEVTPRTEEQVLATRNKRMLDDVTVHEIPYYETSNPQGGVTVYIGE